MFMWHGDFCLFTVVPSWHFQSPSYIYAASLDVSKALTRSWAGRHSSLFWDMFWYPVGPTVVLILCFPARLFPACYSTFWAFDFSSSSIAFCTFFIQFNLKYPRPPIPGFIKNDLNLDPDNAPKPAFSQVVQIHILCWSSKFLKRKCKVLSSRDLLQLSVWCALQFEVNCR